MASRWFHRRNAEVTGPVSFNDLVGLVVDGTLGHDSEVRRDGRDEWQPVVTVIGLAKAIERRRVADEYPDPHPPIMPPDSAPGPDDSVRAAERNERSPIVARAGRFDRTLPQSPGSLVRVGFVSACIALVAWGGWWLWNREGRFPKPAHIKTEPIEWWFPVIGNVSGFEFAVLCVDALIVAGFAVWWIRRRPNRRHADD